MDRRCRNCAFVIMPTPEDVGTGLGSERCLHQPMFPDAFRDVHPDNGCDKWRSYEIPVDGKEYKDLRKAATVKPE